jgi:small subunit ribosomal protein S17
MPRKKKEDEVAIDVAVETEKESIVDNDMVKAVAKSKKQDVALTTEPDTKSNESAATDSRKNRASRIGVVTSDKMMKTVVVRVDRLIKHPRYRKYVRRRKQFMAHDELGSNIGDKVLIVETRPLSARKRWRVVQIIQKAER